MYRPDWADENFEHELLSNGYVVWIRKKKGTELKIKKKLYSRHKWHLSCPCVKKNTETEKFERCESYSGYKANRCNRPKGVCDAYLEWEEWAKLIIKD